MCQGINFILKRFLSKAHHASIRVALPYQGNTGICWENEDLKAGPQNVGLVLRCCILVLVPKQALEAIAGNIAQGGLAGMGGMAQGEKHYSKHEQNPAQLLFLTR